MVLDDRDRSIVQAQLGRDPRGAVRVAWRCPCGKPGVVMTAPRLPGGVPFPTMYYLTCPRAVKALSTLEGTGVMVEMTSRLESDPGLADQMRNAHDSYIRDRDALGELLGQVVPELVGVSAGGMPNRVKCLHALVGHALAVGEGVNPLGDEAVRALGVFWGHPCLGYSLEDGEETEKTKDGATS